MKNIVITGSSSGIGKETALKLLDQGYQIIGLSRTAGFEHKKYLHYSVDFSTPEALESTLKKITARFIDIDALICCAGVGLFGQIEQLCALDINRLMHINFTSQAIVTKAFCRR